ncbi:MAG: hypothetical protein JWO36_5929 [Myxococcales bacterium]|nr:hypothetical protein [Myxococcales bacterium]
MRALVVIVVCALASVAHAQNAEVPGLIKLVEQQPPDMDRSAWKDKRRDATRKLGQSKDKRAVPVLIRIAETETFDIVGEIAIEGLGTLGDRSAVPVLQKIVADTSREESQRDLARKSLAKLGVAVAAETPPVGTGGGSAATVAPTTGGDAGSGSPPPPPETSGGSMLLGTKSAEEMPALPVLPDDVLAAYDRLTFAGGTASLGYDTIRKRLSFAADVAGLYQKRIEREKMAWGVDVAAHVVTGLIDPTGRAQSRGAQLDLNAAAEARFYSGQVYGIGKAAAATHVDYISDVDPTNAMADVKETKVQADLEIAIGGGYGRLLDIGAAIRVRRLARTLEAARALGKPIDAATSKKLQLLWWSLRGDRSSYRSLVATVAVLREAGILLGEPDAGVTYEILNVLRDSQLYVRPSGVDVQLAFGEGYLQRPDNPMNIERGRIEQLLVQAGYGQQLDEDELEISGTAYGRLRLFAADTDPSPWAAGATARLRRFTYGEHGDPFGLFDVTGDVRVSTDGGMMSPKTARIAGELGFTYLLNQASGVRLAAQVAEDGGELFVGGQLTATYGLLDGTFAR